MGIERARSVRAFGRGEKRSTVGRRKNLQWVVDATYRGSVGRPTVGFFLPLLCHPSETRSGSDFRASLRFRIFHPYLGKKNVPSSDLIFYREIPTFEGRSRRPYNRAFRLLRPETLPT